MLKTFLASTAIASLVAFGAYAQENPDASSHEDAAGENQMAPANSPTPEAGDDAVLPEAGQTVEDPAAATPDAAGEEGMAPMQAQEEPAAPAGEDMAPMQAQEQPAAPAGTPAEEYTEVDAATLSADDLIGTSIQTFDDQTVATVNDVILNADGKVENVVAEFGGFLGFGARTVLLTMDDIEVLKDPSDNLVVRTDLTPEAIETRPDYEG
jgi:hypothetical protein